MEHFVFYKLRTPKSLPLQKLIVAQLVKKLSASYETQTSLPNVEEPATCVFP